MRVAGRIAVVTGASSGIGRATAARLAAEGATVVAVARREPQLQALVEELHGRGLTAGYIVADVADREAVASANARVLAEHGRVDVLVNNAGIGLHRAFADCSLDEIERCMQVNFMGAVYWMKAVLPAMTRAGSGSIVNVASAAGAMPYTWEAVYSASKAALIALSEATAPELGRKGIHVAWVNPGLVRTEIFTEESLRHLPAIARRSWLTPERLAAGILDVIEHERPGASIPRTLGVTSLVRHVTPPLFRLGLRRVYESSLRRD
jgi:short-subunit dehydrogenase